MDWDAEAFLKKLKAGEFDGSLNDELLRLSPDQIQELEQFLQRKNQEAWESAGKRKPGPEDPPIDPALATPKDH